MTTSQNRSNVQIIIYRGDVYYVWHLFESSVIHVCGKCTV